MTIGKLARVVVVAALIGTVLSACGSSSKKSSSTTTTTQVQRKNFQVETPSGQASLSLDGKLPPNWPAAFPVPPDATEAGSGSVGGKNSKVLVGVYSTTGTPESAYNFYTSNPAYKVGSKSSLGAGSAFAGTVTFSGAYKGSTTVVSNGGTTYIVAVLDTGGTASTTTTT